MRSLSLVGSTPVEDIVLIDPTLTVSDLPSRSSREGFLGFGHTFSRTQLLVLGDYLKVGDIKKVTLTLACTQTSSIAFG